MNGNEGIGILLVEDNPNDAELALRVMKKLGFGDKVLLLKDGAEAIDFIRGTGDFEGRGGGTMPVVIFLDLRLPKIDGMDVLREIKSGEKTRMIPVVVFTSSGETRDIEECYRLGVNSYVVKPVEYEQYVKTMSDMLSYWMRSNRRPA